MPEFIAEMTPDSLPSAFTQAYLEAIEWLLDESTDNESGESDRERATAFSSEAIEQAIEDCADFQEDNEDALSKAYETGYTEEQAGVDFWLTRNGHGAGFWDRGLGELGERLSKAAKVYGGIDSYVGDDTLIYLT